MIKRILTFCLLLGSCADATTQLRIEIPFPKVLDNFRDTVSVAVIGDVMMHAAQLDYDSSGFLEDIGGWLSEADFAVANMEFTLAGKPYTGYPCFSSPDKYAADVADCGVDVFLTANNHILDKGSKGMSRTLDVYRKMGIKFTGSAGTREEKEGNYPLMLQRRGIKIALINFTYGTNAGPYGEWPATYRMEEKDIEAAFDRAKARDADFIVVLPHWGTEFKLIHSAEQEKWAEKLVADGADVIVGAHPHVVQDSTHINGVPVFYSMGNAVSNMTSENTRLELAVLLRFVRDQLNGDTSMLEPELRFMWCTRPGEITDNYRTVFVDEWKGRREEWNDPKDYDYMITTYERVKNVTRIKDEENH